MFTINEVHGDLFEFAPSHVECMAVWMYFGFSGFKVEFHEFMSNTGSELELLNGETLANDFFSTSDFQWLLNPESSMITLNPPFRNLKYVYLFKNFAEPEVRGNAEEIYNQIKGYIQVLSKELVSHGITSVALSGIKVHFNEHMSEEEQNHRVGNILKDVFESLNEEYPDRNVNVFLVTKNRFGFGLIS